MTRARRWIPGATVALAALVLTVSLAAQALPNLPDGQKLAKSADSPGQVTFNHVTHVDDAKPDCTACHSKLFPIVKGSSAPRTAITHEVMDKGGKCGACHNGKKAFALDDCEGCHQAE